MFFNRRLLKSDQLLNLFKLPASESIPHRRNLMYGVFFYQMCRLRESWEWWRSGGSGGEGHHQHGGGKVDHCGDEGSEDDKGAERIRRFLRMLDSGKLSSS